MNADELPTLRDELETHGLWANKGLGQHFLLDLNITRRIARTAGDLAGQAVIEVGPGPGGLTRALLEAGAHVTAIEKDARFLPLLDPLIEWSGGRLRIVHGDALAADEERLLHEAPAAARIISNLPYNVGTPLLVKWLKAGAWRGDMTLMFQKEVAQRIVAKPGSDAYGRLAVLAQARCDVRLEFTVPARAFTPPPKIASAIVTLRDRADPYPHLDALERVTAAAFGQRRKMLRAALRALTPDAEDVLRAAGIEPTARAEEIDQAGFRRLADAWRQRSS
ncbi:MAG TPA: 16S rRNA (adenine(1518)-N(6)/adenine(1519)-N(6))-dimethyltransferase RsmA [Vitreimonas sp.]|uniref:16S rRNA (adenine(1518)-N(6)/adenine(1519)-N(6))- dimethyltransferase RsmA n=1 Tax=Vitreimonas sp. TaxID=3069702 RepID=UPI002D4386D8|nr:16S rRNA (adenine(1518)-N(6)/adenine(1519)-N(6))-dimethyltransferase RsmA [Vitreimonas sp.]HYD89504.1 16S rRNA (adenine(1518)-N(6)/adenine(1519)-N(6))-dimethyltransferase RsmA [Vitreimonas sp.]